MMSSLPPSIAPLHILGSGSIGLLFAASMKLSKTSQIPIRMLLRSHHKPRLKRSKNHSSSSPKFSYIIQAAMMSTPKGGIVHTMDIPAELISQSSSSSSSQMENEKDVQNILVATKAQDAIDALSSILHRLHPTQTINIIVLSNGVMGVVQDIKHIIKKKNLESRTNIIMASTTNGAHRGNEDDFQSISPDSFCVVHAGLGQTFIQEPWGEGNELVNTLSAIWRDVGLNSNIVSQEEIHVLNWKKLAANCAINPLTAIDRVQNGALLRTNTANQHVLDDRCLKIIDEVSRVAVVETQGLEIGDTLEFDNLMNFVETVIRDTAPNISSMFQDVLAKRHPTEVQYLNGFVARLGEKHGINVCWNRKITEDIENITRPFMCEGR